jgi:hypothetical protein
MSYAAPQVVTLVRNDTNTFAHCDVRYIDDALTSQPAHRMISVTAIVPLSAGDTDADIRERAISVARVAISNAVNV